VEESDQESFDKGINSEDETSIGTVRSSIASSFISSTFPPLNLTVHFPSPLSQRVRKYSNPSLGGVSWKYWIPHFRSCPGSTDEHLEIFFVNRNLLAVVEDQPTLRYPPFSVLQGLRIYKKENV